jgi:hypothetical protein
VEAGLNLGFHLESEMQNNSQYRSRSPSGMTTRKQLPSRFRISEKQRQLHVRTPEKQLLPNPEEQGD